MVEKVEDAGSSAPAAPPPPPPAAKRRLPLETEPLDDPSPQPVEGCHVRADSHAARRGVEATCLGTGHKTAALSCVSAGASRARARRVQLRRAGSTGQGAKSLADWCCASANERVQRLPEYSPDQLPIHKLLASWTGTVLPLTLTKPSFFILPAFHLALALLYEHGACSDDDGDSGLTWCVSAGDLPYLEAKYNLVSVPTTMMIFFLVFYSSQCYARYFQLYSHCVGIGGASMCWVGLVRLHLTDNTNAQWNCVRYNLAAAHLLYYSLSGGRLSDEEWRVIRRRDLLTEEECAQVGSFDGFKPFLLIYWAMREVKSQLRAHVRGSDPVAAAFEWDEFQRIAFELRGHCSQIANLIKQPVPWAYFHLLNVMVYIVLSLVAYILVPLAKWPVTMFTYVIICLIFLGLKNLAVSMADPFGEEVTDFQIEKYLAGMYNHALSHLRFKATENGERLPKGLKNPLDVSQHIKRMATCSALLHSAHDSATTSTRGGIRRQMSHTKRPPSMGAANGESKI